jgi:hypothetical protein
MVAVTLEEEVLWMLKLALWVEVPLLIPLPLLPPLQPLEVQTIDPPISSAVVDKKVLEPTVIVPVLEMVPVTWSVAPLVVGAAPTPSTPSLVSTPSNTLFSAL